MLIGLYIVLPFIKKSIDILEDNLYKCYLVIFISYSFISMLPSLVLTIFNIKININLMVPMMEWQLGCLLLGYFIDNKIKINKKSFITSITVFILCNVFTIYITYIESIKYTNATQNYFRYSFLNIILSAICAFIIIKYLSKYIVENSLVSKFFYFIGSISLEIYLVHPMVRLVYEKVVGRYLKAKIPRLSQQYTVKLILVFTISVLVAYIIKTINNKIKKHCMYSKISSNAITQ